MGIFVPWALLFVAHAKNASLVATMPEGTILDAALMIFPPVLLVIGGMTYYAVIEYFKESNIYQETFIEGEGRQSSRWGSLARDISAYFRACKHKIVRTKESPIYLGRTMWQYDFRLFGHRDIGLISEQHLLTISGSGGGKSRDAIFNNLLSYCGGVCAFSTKNELVENTYRKRWFYSVAYVIDPWDKTSVNTSYWNPLNEIDINNPNTRGRLGRLAQAILPKEGTAARAVDEHFREVPKKILRGYIVHVMTKYPKEQQHLGTVYDLLIKGKVDGGNDYDPIALETVILDMAKNGAVGGSPSEHDTVTVFIGHKILFHLHVTIGLLCSGRKSKNQ